MHVWLPAQSMAIVQAWQNLVDQPIAKVQVLLN